MTLSNFACIGAALGFIFIAPSAMAANTVKITNECAEIAAQMLRDSTVKCGDEEGFYCEIRASSRTSQSLLTEVKSSVGACIQKNGGKLKHAAENTSLGNFTTYIFEGDINKRISVHDWEMISYDAKTVLSILAQ